MIRNLSLMIVVDLEHPETLRESFFNWISFINTSLMNFISDLEPDLRNALQERFEKVYAKNRLVYSTTQDGEPGEVVNVESAMDIDFSLGVPILIVANKSDALDLLEQKAIDSIQYTLRSLAIKYGATVMYASSKSNSNVDTLVDYLSYTLLDDERVKLSVDVSNEKLFIPVGFDHVEDLADEFKDAKNYIFQRKGKQQPTKTPNNRDDGTFDTIDVDEFLEILKRDKYPNPTPIRKTKPNDDNPENITRASVFEQQKKRIMDMLESKKL
jgi:hypothetical protein